MAFILGTIAALLFLEGAWQIAAIAAVALIEIFEIFIYLRWRNVKATTGAEGLMGMTGTVLEECRPDGQVKLKGQIWKAHCRDGAEPGAEVTVERVDGLRLVVSRR